MVVENKKILFVLTRSDVIGGAGIHMSELVRACLNKGYTVKVAIGGKGLFYQQLVDARIDVVSLDYLVRPMNMLHDILAVRELNHLLMEYKPDLIHAHSAKAGLVSRVSGRISKIRTIYTVHGWPFTNGIFGIKKFLFLNVEKAMMFLSDRIITVSHYDLSLAKKHNFPRCEYIVPIHNGVPRPELKRKSYFKNGKLNMVMVARFDKQKNQELLIQSLSGLLGDNWTLDFIGDGPSISYCKQLVESLGLEHNVIFSGFSTEVNKKLVESDLFLLISNWEGLPLTIIEAMALEMPVIASNVGGVSELISDGVNGFLVSEQKSITEAINYYIQNGNKILEHGEESLKSFNSNFDVNLMLNRTFDVYEEKF